MADVTVLLTIESYELVIDKTRLTKTKALINNQLKLAPQGLSSVIGDLDVETLRRSLKPQLPETPVLAAGGHNFKGPFDMVLTYVNNLDEFWTTNGSEQTLVDALIVVAGQLWGTTVDSNDTFLAEGLITVQEAEYYIDCIAKAVLRSLSGEEEGY